MTDMSKNIQSSKSYKILKQARFIARHVLMYLHITKNNIFYKVYIMKGYNKQVFREAMSSCDAVS